MAKQKVDVLIEGGKATAAPPLGPALGPLGVNIGQVVAEINKKTADYKGMQVPVTVEVDTETKEFTITIGTPPTSALLKKEAGIDKGASNPKEKAGDLTFDQIIKVTRMKMDDLESKDLKGAVMQVLGTCVSMGIFVEGKRATEIIEEVRQGKWDGKFKAN
ncbi:MAG: large subunit ribosomal protein [Candidatus Woesearchaeota archaeon]|nr:large subunit ribosomal protein [Candidatus Woesearchaeota archaeon]